VAIPAKGKTNGQGAFKQSTEQDLGARLPRGASKIKFEAIDMKISLRSKQGLKA
jgi:hypothetical protein